MYTKRLTGSSILTLTLAALAAGNTLAADASGAKTRDQVRAELAALSVARAVMELATA